jgi:hypothetical protein
MLAPCARLATLFTGHPKRLRPAVPASRPRGPGRHAGTGGLPPARRGAHGARTGPSASCKRTRVPRARHSGAWSGGHRGAPQRPGYRRARASAAPGLEGPVGLSSADLLEEREGSSRKGCAARSGPGQQRQGARDDRHGLLRRPHPARAGRPRTAAGPRPRGAAGWRAQAGTRAYSSAGWQAAWLSHPRALDDPREGFHSAPVTDAAGALEARRVPPALPRPVAAALKPLP